MNQKHLFRRPGYWTRPIPDRQPTLFPWPVQEALAALSVTEIDVQRWHRNGWISFDIDVMDELDVPHQREIEFIRSLVMSGFGDIQIERLLNQLPQPYSFDTQRIAYHLEYGWVVVVKYAPFDVVEENVSDWIESLGSESNLNRLKDVAALVEEQIDILEAGSCDDE